MLILAEVTVTDAPLAVRLPLSAVLDPTVTLPKLRVVGDTANVPDAVPVPESATLSVEFDAFDITARVPLTAPAVVGEKVAVNVTLWPDVRVRGKFSPLVEKTAPVTFACEMVTDDPPVLVSVSDTFVLLPTCTLPNASEVGLAARVPGATPVPESGMLRLGLPPLEVILRFPLAAPLVVGAKIAVNEVLCPALNVTGKVSPVKLNPAPLAVAPEIVRLAPPELVRVSDKLELLPSSTLPNARLAGFAASVPWLTPVPERGTVKLESEPVEVMLTLPLTAPVAVGANRTVNEVLCPAVNVRGKVSPLKLNPLPLAVAAEIVRLVPPVLVKVSGRLELLPTCTLPNARLVGFGVKAPCVTPVPVSGMLRLGFPPLEVMLIFPVVAPLAVGAKFTVNDVL